ncbi:MAG: MATE family efflux transporter [Alphaproteobacteria bacterium]
MTSAPKPYANKGNLTEGSITHHLIRLTVPMTWGIFAIISFQLVDMFFIAMLGTKELAALSLTFPVTMGIFSLFIGFQIAMASVGSRLIGGGEVETMRRVTTHAVCLVFMLGILIALAGYALHDTIFRALGATPATLPLIWSYMSIWLAGAVFITVPMVSNAAMRANGDTRTPALIMTIVAVINLILDPILIFGLFGFPRLEMQGAAIATVFANACAMAAGLAITYKRHALLLHPLKVKFDTFKNSAARILFIAIPAGITNTIQPLVNAFIFALLAKYGESAIAAFGVATRIEAFAFIILMALSTGMAPIIGQNWGAKNFDRVEKTLKIAISFSVAWSLLVALVFGLSGQFMAGLFSDDPQMIAYAVLFFWIVPFSYAFSNLVLGWGSAFNAMGMPKRSMLMIVVKMIALMIPAVLIGEHLYGVTGIFIAIAVVNVVAGIVFQLTNWSLFKKQQALRLAQIEPS